MIKEIFVVISLFLISTVLFSQDRTIDSLLLTRKTDSLDGSVKTYYSPGNKKIATELQQLVSDAILYYENKYKIKFNLQMIVLDSGQWFKEISPYLCLPVLPRRKRQYTIPQTGLRLLRLNLICN